MQRPEIVFLSQVRGLRRVKVGFTELPVTTDNVKAGVAVRPIYFATSSRVLAAGVAAEVRSRMETA